MITSAMNYYEILEVTPEATRQEIESAYRSAKETYSTANSALYSMFDHKEALELHRLIEEAYTTLSNPDLKRKYDESNGVDEASLEAQIKTADFEPVLKAQPSFEHVQTGPFLRDGVIITEYNKDAKFEEKMEKLDDCTGLFLQRVRKYRNISIDELSHFSKISKTNILAIENEDKDNLPARVFIRGFASQLSRLLGLNDKDFANGYMKAIDGN